jgi:hypothetical protein
MATPNDMSPGLLADTAYPRMPWACVVTDELSLGDAEPSHRLMQWTTQVLALSFP